MSVDQAHAHAPIVQQARGDGAGDAGTDNGDVARLHQGWRDGNPKESYRNGRCGKDRVRMAQRVVA